MDQIEDPYKGRFTTVNWMGREWYLKTSKGKMTGPGPNIFDASNITVNGNQLTLNIKAQGDNWVCSELISKDVFKYGVFNWNVEGDVYNLDKNVVFAMFLYPPSPSVAPDGTNQIDIQFAKWGHDKPGNLDYTLFTGTPVKQKPLSKCLKFHYQNSTLSSHQVIWKHDSIQMQSKHLYDHMPPRIVDNYQHPTQPEQVPQIPLRCHMNLWLFKSKGPSDGKDVKIKFTHFNYSHLQ